MARILSLVARCSIAVAVLGGICSCPSLARAEQKGTLVGITQLPPAVKAAAEKAAGPLDWLIAFRFDRPSAWYRLAARDSRKNLVQVNVLASGEIIDVRTEIAVEAVPDQVMKEIERGFPNFQPKNAESVGESVGRITSYVVQGIDAGKPRTIQVVLDEPAMARS